SAPATSSGDSRLVQSVWTGRSETSSATAAVSRPSPTSRSRASGTCGAARRHAAATPSPFLYRSRAPTKRAVGFSGSAVGGGLGKAEKSVYVVTVAVGTPPASITSRLVNGDTVRTASADRTAARASCRLAGSSAPRSGDP